jgi:hypothetical protein
MGGPKAWKEMQDRQTEFLRGFDEPPPPRQVDSDDEEVESDERIDVESEYNIEEEETVHEREARGDNADAGEEEGYEV